MSKSTQDHHLSKICKARHNPLVLENILESILANMSWEQFWSYDMECHGQYSHNNVTS